MNSKRFELVMGAVDDDLLEEAQCPLKGLHLRPWVLGAAACFVVVAALYLLIRPGEESPTALPPNSVHESTITEVAQIGYTLPVPDSAKNVSYALIDAESQDSAPMAEVVYESNGRRYSCRALKVSDTQDISGMDCDWTQSLDWLVGTLDMQLRQSDAAAWVGWYAPDAGIQWCLSGEADAQSLLHTAQGILDTLGYSIAVAPEGAEDVLYNAFELDGLTVGETTFVLDGVSYSYRMAQTFEVEQDFADISGLKGDFQNETAGEIMWCPARLYFDAGGAGRVVWFDVVPGLLYSLSMEQGASEEALLEMAGQLFAPAQGDVG